MLNVDTANTAPVQLKAGYNEYCITQNPFHPFNDPLYVSHMQDSNANIVRFPGGTIGNFYDWVDDDFLTEELQAKLPNAANDVPRDKFATQAEYDAMVTKYQGYLQNYIDKGTLCRQYRTTSRGVYGYTDFLDLAARWAWTFITWAISPWRPPAWIRPIIW